MKRLELISYEGKVCFLRAINRTLIVKCRRQNATMALPQAQTGGQPGHMPPIIEKRPCITFYHFPPNILVCHPIFLTSLRQWAHLFQTLIIMTYEITQHRAVLPNLCAARAVEVCRGRMLEIKSFNWEVSMKFSIVIENIWFCKFSRGTLLSLHHNIVIWSLNRSSVIVFDALFRLSLHGRCLSL